MSIIKNYDDLNITPGREVVLEAIEAALEAIHPDNILQNDVRLESRTLRVKDETYDLNNYDRVFVVGIGKGSALNCRLLEEKLGDILTAGWAIDVVEREGFAKIRYTKGTHPLPSEENRRFAQTVLRELEGLTERDLVLFVVCGGGSALLFLPHKIPVDEYISLTQALLKSGADIGEINTIRKHIDAAKGGAMAKVLYPASVVGLIFSDVLGDDLSVIASGPLTMDTQTIEDAKKVAAKYDIEVPEEYYVETNKDEKYFEKVKNILLLNSSVALEAMVAVAEKHNIAARIYSTTLEGEAAEVGRELLEACTPGEILVAGGETTVTVTGDGKGGRNQELVLGSLGSISGAEIIASVNSDGWDNTDAAGAIGDSETIRKANEKGLNIAEYIKNNDSYNLFEQTGDNIKTGRLPSNISDFMIVYKPEQ